MCGIVDILLILIVILFILLIWRGPSMLPQLGEALGKAVRGVRENVDADSARQDDGRATAVPPPQDVAAAPGEQGSADRDRGA
jgi:Sec-independent protein translocase protein TatA